ncbi:dual E2 ubiquitin-conjugating enzyme/E3 ubiquitin-protein ligase BIRC6-like isoform X3 [Mytilus galloprovincialis]|uniref:dual E2 ubiquitin-conjugating enzyme/E3 ubiquitin-protein ligase BIRC6-like isoform X3 n=1 Tax=Mytilus galloprovincialis TaxID=29158 RepID=UPI003F7BC0D1
MAATEKQWFVGEDGCISVGEPTRSVTYNSALNSIIVSTKEPSVKIYDVASGSILQKSNVSAHGSEAIRCIYLPESNRVVFCDESCIGVRSDLKGMLLLDTALQAPVKKNEEKVKVEIPLAEATHLLKSLTSAELPGVDNVDEVVKELEKGIELTQETTKGSLKISKWATVCVEIQHCILKNVCSSLVTEMKKLSLFNPGLSAASAVSDRLSYLLNNHMSDSSSSTVERLLMYSEAARQDTFRKWPHMNYKWALPDPMAQAGFYHQPNSIGDDRAMCFTCNVCLVCWEPTDEPWSEHERHSPACPFVKGEYTHNVPLSVTYASQPAKRHGDKKDKIECISSTTSDDFVATSTLNGNIVVWNCRHVMKRHCQFNIDPTEIYTTIAMRTGTQIETETSISSPEGAEGVHEDETDAMLGEYNGNGETTEMYEIPIHNGEKPVEPTKTQSRPCEDIRVKSVCVLRKPFDEKALIEKSNASKSNKKWRSPQPTLLCGASLRCQKLTPLSNNEGINGSLDSKTEEVQIMNQVNEVVSCNSSSRIIEEDENSSCEDELVNTASFIPHLLMLAVKETKRKSIKSKDKRIIHRVSSMTNNNVPSLGSLTMSQDFSLLEPMFETDPDVQIVGVTPGPSISSPNEDQIIGSSFETSRSDVKITRSHSESAIGNSSSGKVSSKVKAGTILQYIELPKEYQRSDLEVGSIVPTLDRQHVIVMVIPKSKSVISDCVSCNGRTESTLDLFSAGGCMLLYRYKFGDEYAVLEERPVFVKSIDSLDNAVTNVLVLPSDVCESSEEEDEGGIHVPNSQLYSKSCDVQGLIVVTLASGKFWLMNVCDFVVLAEVLPPENDKFISSTYCSGIERLCLSSENGKLHFYQLCEQSPVQIELTADSPDGVCNGDIFHEPEVNHIKSDTDVTDKVDKKISVSDILARQPLSVENLMILHNLIQFENLMPRFTATVPPCWSEIQQEQQQRRHPQHLQQQGEATQHTRTWKLQPDSSTWEEHMFEVVLTRPCCVGHVDVKFSLHPMCTTCPDIQITLLKQNITSIGQRQTGSNDVDRVVDFNLSPGSANSSTTSLTMSVKGESSENHVLDPSFLESHNAEVLCGPVNISNCLDLSGNSGLITLTSPQLLNSKPKAFLIHMKGFPSKADECSDQPKEAKKKSGSQLSAHKLKIMKKAFDNDLFVPPSSVKDQQSSSLPRPKYPENLKGCDWLSELSVTIRKTKKTQLSKERIQRISMLENCKFHDKLLDGMSVTEKFNGVSSDHWQNMILDILLWISSVQLNDPEKSNINKSLSLTIQKRLTELVKSCFIQGSRTTAHKCSKLAALCMEHCKLSPDQDLAPAFSFSLLQALMENLQMIPSAQSSGAIRWFFTLLNRVKCMDVVSVAESCTDLLMQISKHSFERTSSLYSLLKSRYGLYGQPFDSDLFDSELPISLKQSAPSSSYASAVSSTMTGVVNNSNTNSGGSYIEEIDFYDLFYPPSDKSSKVQLEYAKNNVFGMLEVEPLHFTCHATSDGTKMEKMDQQGISSIANNTSSLGGTINFGEWNPPSSAAAATAANLSSLSSKMAVTKQHLQELSNKTYPMFKHKIMHIKQILSEVGKSLPTAEKYNSDQLLPPTPKSTPQVITPPLTPPNEYFQNQAALNKADKLFPSKSNVGMQNAQTLLQQPPLQALVIERMHSGARRFVILDFGKPIVLTDVVIPACTDLASLSIDVWVQGEEVDGQRFVVATDIGVKSLIMNDIIPTLVCRYLKITTIGRYGSGSARSKIPIGSFYGHGYILPWEWNSYLEQRSSASLSSSSTSNQVELTTQSQLLAQLDVYVSLLEDIQCRYSLARTRLENLLLSVDGQHYASSHIQYFLKKSRKNNDEDNKILQAYNDCLQLQLQQNLAQRVIDRLQAALGVKLPKLDCKASLSLRLRHACTDKLRFLQERLLDTLLSMTTCTPSIPLPPQSLYNILCPQTAQTLFKHLCVHGKKKTQISAGVLLMRVCGTQPWWGNFFGNVLQEFFHSENLQIFPQDRVFVLLVAMGQKSLSGPCAVTILESLLDMLAKVLSPILTGQPSSSQTGLIDLTLVSWILLFLCRNLEHTSLNNDDKGACAKTTGSNLPNRWNFIQGDHANTGSKSKSKSAKAYRWSMQKRLQHHKKKLMDLEQAQKTFFTSQFDSPSSSNTLLKQQEKQFRKELSQYATKMRRNDAEVLRKLTKSGDGKGGDDDDNGGILVLSKEKTLKVVRGLMALLLSMDFTCNVDLFLVTCKVLATVCVMTRPAVTLSEAMTQDQLGKLILLASNLDLNYGNVSWGGPWAGHAITCLLQDILDGERYYPAPTSRPDLPEDLVNSVADESLPHSVSLPTMSNLDDTEQDQDQSSGENNDNESDYKTESTKMNFDKESSLMVDLLLDESGEYDEDTSAKLHEYVTGETLKPSHVPGPHEIYETSIPTTSLNGTIEVSPAISIPVEAEKKKNYLKKIYAEKESVDHIISMEMGSGIGPPYKQTTASQGMSTAVDARLELGLETQAELKLKVMVSLHTENVQQSFSFALPSNVPTNQHFDLYSATDDELTETNNFITQQVTSPEMLSQCYEHLFRQLVPNRINLDALLQLWVTLNCDSGHDGGQITFDPTRTPLIPLSETAVANLLNVVALTPSIQLSTWVLVFQTLSLLANQKVSTPSGDKSMVVSMIADSNLISAIKKFLSGTSEHGPLASAVQYTQVGPSATKFFYEFLMRLLIRCSPDSLGHLHELMLKLVYTLTAERGAIHCGLGPLDAQCKFMDVILEISFEQVDISNAISVIESISTLVDQHLMSQERVTCRSSSENSINARSCFGGLFASLLRGGDSKTAMGDSSRDLLMCSLLKLVNSLIQIKLGSRNNQVTTLTHDAISDPHTPTNISLSEPVTDSTKLSQALATSTPVVSIITTSTPMLTMCDDDKSQQTDEQKTETRNNAPVEPMFTYLTDIILGHRHIMNNLIQALSYCNSNTMAAILGSREISSHMQETFTGGDPISVGDGIYQILVTLSRHCSDQKSVLESLLQYMSGSYLGLAAGSLCRLSEPLLWFALKVLDSTKAVRLFLDMNGIEVICQNLVNTNSRIINTSPSLISTIMQNLNGKTRDKRSDSDSADGLQNFAPFGSVSSSSPTASPAEVLIQAAPPHRRARSAAWSYHFYPDEAWVDLTVQLPFAILLSEVQIQPHSASLTTCPAYVSLEISHDGVTNTPQCQPLMTSSLAFIKLQLQRPQIATTLTIRLHKARDSMTIGLSQLMLMGYSAFGYTGSSTQNILLPTVDFISQSSVRWIRLLHHCLTAHKEVEELVAAAAATTSSLLTTCSALLVSPVSASSVYYYNIEAVLLKLGLHSLQMGLVLIDNILRSPSVQQQRDLRTPFMGKVSGLANDSTVELLYQLGITQDPGTSKRVQALLNWLGDSARVALQKTAFSSDGYSRIPHHTTFMSLPSPAPTHIHCVAVILWQSHQLPVEYNLNALITKDLISSLYEWSITLTAESTLKKAVDDVLCSSCHISPEFFTQILTWVGISFTVERNGFSESVSDDIKDSSHLHRESMTDDSKEANSHNIQTVIHENHYMDLPSIYLKEFRHISLEETHLTTLANTCKSPVAIRQLLDSGFPAVLAQGLFEFCNKMISRFSDNCVSMEGLTDTSKTMSDESSSANASTSRCSSGTSQDKSLWITADLVGAVLHFFAELSTEPLMKDWLGEAEGNIFWPSLLTLLCNAPVQTATVAQQAGNKSEPMSVEDRTSIETSAVQFFNHVISCHLVNQLLFAKVMCEVIKEQSIGPKNGPTSNNFPLSGFARCLFLQVLLEDEKILVSLKLENQQQKIQTCKNAMPMEHPKLCGGRSCQCMMVSLHTTCSELLHKLSESYSLPGHFIDKPSEKPSDEAKKDFGNITSEFTDISSTVVSGLIAKEKREKDDKLCNKGLPPRPPTRRRRYTADTVSSQLQPPNFTLYHPLLPNKPLPGDLTLSQLLQVLHLRGLQHGSSLLEFTVKLESKKPTEQSCNQPDDWTETDEEEHEMSQTLLLTTPSFPSALQIFASVGGLALLAEHLPLLYDPELTRQPTSQEGSTQSSKSVSNTMGVDDWVTVEPFPEEFYELYEPISPAPTVPRAANSSLAFPTIPPHSLIAFGLFLRLPGYAEVLLKERKKAQCLLRLVLGVTDDGDGGHILTSSIASALPTLPFLVLKSLYDSMPLTTDDGVLLRRMSLEIWALHLILACLSVLSHHLPRVSMPGFQQEAQMILTAMQTATTTTTTTAPAQTEEKSQQYWAKGTGFGTGSTTSSWDAEQALLRQKQEEEHVACLLQVLASYVNPGGEVPTEFDSTSFSCPSEKMLLPDMIPELLSQSCLIPAISSYLRNDSVLDMARHIPMYRSLLELLRGIAVCPALVPLLLPLDKDNNQDTAASIGLLLEKMRKCVDTYASRLKSNKGKNGSNGHETITSSVVHNVISTEEEEENEGLALLIPNIQETARIVKIATDRLQHESGADHSKSEDMEAGNNSLALKHNTDEKYMAVMKPLQFDVFQIVEDEGNGIKFNCRHHYENNVRTAGDNSNPARTRRLAQEAVTLSTSLPLSAGSSVFVRCDEERLDIMKVLITGPSETPYANGCFEFDVYFPQDYPNSPPFINLATTGNHTVRFNPNLYNDGKVCLSVLNTWHGRPEEKWNSQTSSFLQVLVSIQSLILVSEPYFNEPGYERSRGTPSGTANSREYDANIRQATVKWAMLEQLKNPCPSLKDIIQRHFWIKRKEILKQCEDWITEMEGYSTDKRTGRTIAHSTMALKRHYNQLREELAKMKPPEDLEEESEIDLQERIYSTESSMSTSLCDMPGSSIPNDGSIMDSNSNTIVEDVVEIL